MVIILIILLSFWICRPPGDNDYSGLLGIISTYLISLFKHNTIIWICFRLFSCFLRLIHISQSSTRHSFTHSQRHTCMHVWIHTHTLTLRFIILFAYACMYICVCTFISVHAAEVIRKHLIPWHWVWLNSLSHTGLKTKFLSSRASALNF